MSEQITGLRMTAEDIQPCLKVITTADDVRLGDFTIEAQKQIQDTDLVLFTDRYNDTVILKSRFF